jgi:hypothetical protein
MQSLFNLPVSFTLQVKNFLENFISQSSTDLLVFSKDLSGNKKKHRLQVNVKYLL